MTSCRRGAGGPCTARSGGMAGATAGAAAGSAGATGATGPAANAGSARAAGGGMARRMLGLLLAAALAVCGPPAQALAAGMPLASDNALEAEVGIALNVPAGTETATRQEGGDVGVRLTIPRDSADEAEERTVEGTVGIRLTLPSEREQEERTVEGTVGIRMTVPEKKRVDAQTLESTVGIRLALPGEDGRDEQRSVEGTVGIRLEVPAQSEPEERTIEGTVGIRLNVPAIHTVTFDAGEGRFASTGLPTWQLQVGRGSSVAATLGGSMAEKVGAPVCGGRAFLGWYVDPAHTARFDEAAPVTGSTTVYAAWSELVDVVYDARPGGVAAGSWGDPLVEAADGTLVWSGARSGVDKHALPKAEWTGAGDVELVGWWVKDAAGEWAYEVHDGDVIEPSETGATVTVYARWAKAQIAVRFVDEDGSALDGAEGVMRDDVTLDYGQPPTDEVSDYDPASGTYAVPTRKGYALDGFWWEPAGGGGGAGAGAAGAERAVRYYGVDFEPGAGGRGTWVLGPDVAGGWTLVQHAEDLEAADGSPVGEAHPADGIADTVVLTARWTATMRATVPCTLTFALQQTGDEAPKAVGPAPDEQTGESPFAIRNWSPAPVTLAQVRAEGADGTGGIPAVLYTTGTGASRTLDWGAMDGEMVLTLEPQAPDAQRMSFAVAGYHGPTASDASPAIEVPAWDEGADDPGRLPIEVGLNLPAGVRAYESGSTGEIARVTFTLTMSQ